MSTEVHDAAEAGRPLRRYLLWVFIGGVLGGVARLALIRLVPGLDDAWGVLVANLLGAFLLGVLFERLTEHRLGRTAVWAFWGPGVMGALTTFSSLAALTVAPMRDGAWLHGALYLTATVCLGLPLAALGRRAGQVGG